MTSIDTIIYAKYPEGIGGVGLLHHDDFIPALTVGNLRVYAWDGIPYQIDNIHLVRSDGIVDLPQNQRVYAWNGDDVFQPLTCSSIPYAIVRIPLVKL